MQSFINFLSEYAIIIGVIFFLVVIVATAISVWRKGNRRREAERQLAKARETIANNREAAGLPRIHPREINVGGYSTFDFAQREYVTNPARLLVELNKLNAGLEKLVGNGCTCTPEWKLTIPGYSGQATIRHCANLADAVSDGALTSTINALSAGGLNSSDLHDGHIVKMAKELVHRAADDSTRRPGYTLDCRYIGAVLQQFDYGNRIVIRRGRNPAREDSHLAMNDADALLAELKAGTYRTAFITVEDGYGRRPEGQLTAIVMHGDTVTVT